MYRAHFSLACVFAFVATCVVGPVAAATTTTVVAQATQGQAILSGVVRDSRGVAQGGASVAINGPGGPHTVKTGPDGRFSFTVSPGIYSLSIDKGGFETYRLDDVVATAGTPNDSTYNLTTATTATSQEIGRVSVRNGLTPMNHDVTAIQTISGDEIINNPTPNLDFQITDLPGISLIQGNRSTLAFFNIRGSVGGVESRTEIDGHPLSTGISGVYYTGLLNPGIFESATVEKGPGISAADAGESSFGTINLVTWDFSDKTQAFAQQGIDSYNGQFTSALLRGSLLPRNKLSYVFDYNVQGYNGPAFGINGPLLSANGSTSQLSPTYTVGINGGVGSALVDYLGPFDSGQRLTSEVAKLRYRFSDTTSVWVGYVGSQGYVNPEGSSYGYNYGQYVIAPCFNGSTPQTSLSSCNQSSTYSNPLAAPYFGQQLSIYSAYPAETQTENNPLFEAEFRTSFKNDTLLIRPFTQVVQRINDGSQSATVPGNNGAFSLATLPSQCTAANPCYINNAGSLASYTSSANPCAASNTPVANSCYQDGAAAPYYQFELDRLHGVTGTYLHPLGALGTMRVSYEYTSDYTYDITGYTPTQTTPLAIAGYPAFSQSLSDVSNVSIPGALRRSNDVSIAAFLTPSPKFSIAAGLFYDLDSLDFSYENPAILALAPYVPNGTTNLPLNLLQATVNKTHLDPHLGFVFNISPKLVIRLLGGSSVTLPYANIISGLPVFEQPTTTLPFGYYKEKNPYLTPETTVAYNTGLDYRLPDNGVFTFDIYENTIHNAFLTEYSFPNGMTAPALSQTVNASTYQSSGLEFGFKKTPTYGLGYNAQVSLNRAFYYNLGPAYYSSNTGYLTVFDNQQLDGQPFATGHAAFTYNADHNLRVEFGLNYEGNNNSYYIPPFETFYFSAHRDIVNHVSLLLSGRNIFGQSNLPGVAKATSYVTSDGLASVECKYGPSPSNPQQYVQTGCQPYTNGQQQIEPQSFSLAVQVHL